MQKILKGSKTEANLMAAFAGESQARNKYTFYGAKAKADGFEQIGNLFLETANGNLVQTAAQRDAGHGRKSDGGRRRGTV